MLDIRFQLMVFLHRCLLLLHCLCKIPVWRKPFRFQPTVIQNPLIGFVIGELFWRHLYFPAAAASGAPVSGRRAASAFSWEPAGRRPSRVHRQIPLLPAQSALLPVFFLLFPSAAPRRALCGKDNRIITGENLRHTGLDFNDFVGGLLNQSTVVGDEANRTFVGFQRIGQNFPRGISRWFVVHPSAGSCLAASIFGEGDTGLFAAG